MCRRAGIGLFGLGRCMRDLGAIGDRLRRTAKQDRRNADSNDQHQECNPSESIRFIEDVLPFRIVGHGELRGLSFGLAHGRGT
jgi:hypothetical protein